MTEILEMLQHIHPATCAYEDWLHVGMALQHEGHSPADWERWSARDPERYRQGECQKKWESFRGSNPPVTIATVAQIAKERGFVIKGHKIQDEGYALNWDSPIGGNEARVPSIDANWVEDTDIPAPSDPWDYKADLITYLSTMFEGSDHVGYVTQCYEADGRKLPKRGIYARTAGDLIESIKQNDSIESALSSALDPEAGAWIRVNPLDGNGCRDVNVTAFKYTLVESDTLPIPRQYAILREMELPIACLVHSGGKSLHAIVRVDAESKEEYRERVNFIYDVGKRSGLELDSQNRNPSRLSRLPGVTRNGKPQYLLGTNYGKPSFAEWKDWIEDLNDDLPDIEVLEPCDEEPEVAPELIEGVLRAGHKMLIAGPSKAGKSFMLQQLCIAIATGTEWLGWKVQQGTVLYVNLELDKRSNLHRFWEQHKALGLPMGRNIEVWNLRGNATSLDKLAPKLIRRAQQRNYTAIVIDPIYKVLTGDENSAEAMAHFCNQFDLICHRLEAATIYCHHHSKGAQGQKRSADRASGSGVFARDPDAIMDLIELNLDDAAKAQISNVWECDALGAALDEVNPDWRESVGQDDQIVAKNLVQWLESQGMQRIVHGVRPKVVKEAKIASAWRVEATCREFAKPDTKNLWFRHPRHIIDETGVLEDAKAEGEEEGWKGRKKDRIKVSAEDRKQERLEALEAAVGACNMGEGVTVDDLAGYMGVNPKTIRNRVKEHPEIEIENNRLVNIANTPGRGN